MTGIWTATTEDFAEDIRVCARMVQLHTRNLKDSLGYQISVLTTLAPVLTGLSSVLQVCGRTHLHQ